MIVCSECGSILEVREEKDKKLVSKCEKCIEKIKEESYEEGYECGSDDSEIEAPVYEKQMEKFYKWFRFKYISNNTEVYSDIFTKLVDLDLL